MRLAYYAHSQSTYGTKQEELDIQQIRQAGFEVYNPDNPDDGPMFIKYGMAWFDMLLCVREFDAVFFRALTQGPHANRITYGTNYEVNAALERGLPVFELITNVAYRGLSKEGTGQIYSTLGRDDLAKLY